jgi:hypothetical protein
MYYMKSAEPREACRSTLPFSSICLLVDIGGYPVFEGYKLYKNKDYIMEDKILHANMDLVLVT